MKFAGELKFPDIDHPGVPVQFVIDANQAELVVEGESLGRWSLYDVHARRLIASAFEIDLDGTEVTFVAADPIDFAYRGVEHMAETWAAIKSRAIATRTIAVRKSRKGTKPSRIEDLRAAMESNLETGGSRPIAGEPAMPPADVAVPEPGPEAVAAPESDPMVGAGLSEAELALEAEKRALAEERARFEEERRAAEQREANLIEAYRIEVERLEAERSELRRQAAQEAEANRDAVAAAAAPAEMEGEDTTVEERERHADERAAEVQAEIERQIAEREAAAREAAAREAAAREAAAREAAAREAAAREAAAREAAAREEATQARSANVPEPSRLREEVVDLDDLQEGDQEPPSGPEGEPTTSTPGSPEPEPALAGAPKEKSGGLMGAVKAAFRGGSKDHEHKFVEAPGGMGITRYVCEECGYVSIAV